MTKRLLHKGNGTIGRGKALDITIRNNYKSSYALVKINDEIVDIKSISELKKFIAIATEVLEKYDLEQEERGKK